MFTEYHLNKETAYSDNTPYKTESHIMKSSSAIAERLHCRVGQFWPKVEYNILQTI